MADLHALDPRVRGEAARRLWERFAPRLCALARSRLDPRIRVREDENDIVQSLFQSFFADQQGRPSPLRDREELWRLLVWMTLCKVANAAHHHRRARRDVRRERPLALPRDPLANDSDSPADVPELRVLAPEDEVISRLELARMLRRLRKDQRQIIAWKLDGYTNAEIGRKITRTERTVEIKLQLIRQVLARDPLVGRALGPSSGRGGGSAP
jgi:DNA-directed RNA polymerase specialized sigma24 family protein